MGVQFDESSRSPFFSVPNRKINKRMLVKKEWTEKSEMERKSN